MLIGKLSLSASEQVATELHAGVICSCQSKLLLMLSKTAQLSTAQMTLCAIAANDTLVQCDAEAAGAQVLSAAGSRTYALPSCYQWRQH